MGLGLCQGVWRGVPCMHTHAHMHACTHAYMYKHDNFMQMAAPIGKSWGIPLWHHHSHMCACTCVHAHAWGTPQTPWQSPTHPHPPKGGTPRISQNSIALELIEIFQFCLKIWNLWRLPHPWVGGWVGSGQNTKNLKNVDWIKIIQFCLKIYDL